MARAKKAEAAEVWADVPGFDGLYQVSSLGVVRSLPRSTATGVLGGRILKPHAERNGYLRIALSRGGETTRYSVHRLVLLAFAGYPAEGLEARHLDGNRKNNHLSNLAWGSRSENAHDRVRHGTNSNNTGERHPNSRLTDGQSIAIRRQRARGASLAELSAAFGVSKPTISRIINLRGWKHLPAERGVHV